MENFLTKIDWKKLGKGSFFLGLYIVLGAALFKSNLLSKLSEPNSFIIIILIFFTLPLLYLFFLFFGSSKSRTFTDKFFAFGSVIILFLFAYFIFKNLNKIDKSQNFYFKVIENGIGSQLDSVYFETVHGEKGYSRLGIISFDYIGSYDTTFTVKLSKKGFVDVIREVYRGQPCSLKRIK